MNSPLSQLLAVTYNIQEQGNKQSKDKENQPRYSYIIIKKRRSTYYPLRRK